MSRYFCIFSYVIYEIQETNKTLLYKNISLTLFLKGAHCLLLVWEIDGDKYFLRGELFLSHTFFRELSPLAPYRQWWPDASGRLRVPRSTLCSLHCLNLTAWLSRGLLPVTHPLNPTGQTRCLPPCLLITTWQPVKAHGVTRNEPKIYVICCITMFLKIYYFFWPEVTGE